MRPANKRFLNPVSIFIAALVLLALAPAMLQAQEAVSPPSKASSPHSVAKAAIFSAVLPGLGQVYNKKAWKVPVVYAGFGVLSYFIVSNNKQFQTYREAYVYVANGDTYPIDNELVGKYSLGQLSDGMEYYRRNRDLSYIITGLWYTLNILEAYVDAHFFDYDISEDLSLQLRPAMLPVDLHNPSMTGGLTLSLRIKP